MSTRTKRLLFIGAGLVLSAAALWGVFRGAKPDELWAALQKPNYWWLLPNLMLVVLAMYQRALRWRYMIEPIKSVKYKTVLAATCVGFMANNVLPLRLGEYVRAYSLSHQDKQISKSSSLATIFVERTVFDLVALLLILAVVLYITPLELDGRLQRGITVAVGVALVGLLFIVVMALKPEKLGDILTRYLFFVPETVKEKIRGVVMRFAQGLDFMKDLGKLSSVTLHTMLIWLAMGFSNYFVFLSFGFDLPVEASYVLLVVVSVLIMVPSSPGFFGVYHLGTFLTLKLYDVPDVDARAFSIVLHLAQYIPVTLLGFYFLKKEHLSLKSLEQEAVEEVDDVLDEEEERR